MYKRLDKVLYKTRSSLVKTCKELDIDPKLVNPEELLNACCNNCGIWSNRFTEMVDEDVCLFCDDLDTLRF